MAKDNKRYKSDIGLSIISYLGLTGSGKSLSAVENHVIPDLVRSRSVYSNTWINWKSDNLKLFTSWQDLHDVRNSLIFIDEVGDFLDPIAWKEFSKEDKNVIRYHRKRGNDLVYTAQDISDVAKTVRVKSHKYFLCEATPDSDIVKWFFKTFLGYERVCFNTLMLTFKDLKKLSLGVGSPAIDKTSDLDDDENSFSEDISDIRENLAYSKDQPKPETLKYKISTLLHKELNDYKINFFGYWCDDCRAFKQYIDKLDSPALNCPSHPDLIMSIKPLAMYDTNAELETKKDDLITKTFKYINKKTLVQT